LKQQAVTAYLSVIFAFFAGFSSHSLAVDSDFSAKFFSNWQIGGWGDGGMVSHCAGLDSPTGAASGATRYPNGEPS
jgi:hypothetical protein